MRALKLFAAGLAVFALGGCATVAGTAAKNRVEIMRRQQQGWSYLRP